MFQDISALSVMANADYYEVVRLGHEETKHYICSICEKEKKMFVSEESELRIIQHIQKNHAEKHLVVETTKKITKLVSHSSKEPPQDGMPVQKFKLRQSNVKIKDHIAMTIKCFDPSKEFFVVTAINQDLGVILDRLGQDWKGSGVEFFLLPFV